MHSELYAYIRLSFSSDATAAVAECRFSLACACQHTCNCRFAGFAITEDHCEQVRLQMSPLRKLQLSSHQAQTCMPLRRGSLMLQQQQKQ